MNVMILGMEMPKDCPLCPLSHFNKLDEFTGCEVVSGKKYAMTKDTEYANSSNRPDWCPLVAVPDNTLFAVRNSILYQQLIKPKESNCITFPPIYFEEDKS